MSGARISLANLVCLLFAVHAAVADDVKPPALSPQVDRVLQWLPDDTETLLVAQSFEIRIPDAAKDLDQPSDLITIINWVACGDLLLKRDMVPDSLIGKKVALAITGGRDYEGVSAFGSLRSEGCSVIVFETDLGDAGKEWAELLRSQTKSVRALGGREVFVFPSTTVMEGVFKLKPWQGSYFVLLRPDTLLTATSDRYLKEVLRRVDGPEMDRALPTQLGEWKHVDPRALAWMLRHTPENDPTRLLIGTTWSLKENQLRIVLIPNTHGGDQVERLMRSSYDADGRTPATVEKQTDGSVTVSFPATNLDYFKRLGYTWQLYHLQGFTGTLGEH